MRLDELIEHFGSNYRLSKACGFSQPVPFTWRMRGFIPMESQRKIEAATNGLFKANEDDARRK